MVNHIGNLVVRRRVSPVVRYGLIATGVALAVLGGAGLFWWGESAAGFDVGRAAHDKAQARARIARLRHEVKRLSVQLAISKRLLQSGNVAYAALSAALKKSDARRLHLKERVGFYETVLAASKAAKGLKIEHFQVVRASSSWRYDLVLVQPFAANRWTYARVRLTVQGQGTGRPSGASAVSLVDTPRDVHFKYFDEVRGPLKVPAHVIPHKVMVRVVSGGRVVTHSYPWPNPTSPGPHE
ncbi:DUF6776 family protein [Acidiferrobacter thiooxydans]|uniref:Uncharacterized protein n=1 Tax=Acidiferrobacter thiooxydans TaxID=163359 RepID=A0A368HJQ8_9GAMM|nr:DUF6776 family protein [Acidiferrobacter thiooxydans]RCN58689.1 hypothetical protein C4900_02610 [Acidiferrobacter thiooxydans]